MLDKKVSEEKALEIVNLLEKIKKEEPEITKGIEALGGINENEPKLKEISQIFEESKKAFGSLLKTELPKQFGIKFDPKIHTVDYFIEECHKIAGGGYRLQLGKLRDNRLKLKIRQSFILQMHHMI